MNTRTRIEWDRHLWFLEQAVQPGRLRLSRWMNNLYLARCLCGWSWLPSELLQRSWMQTPLWDYLDRCEQCYFRSNLLLPWNDSSKHSLLSSISLWLLLFYSLSTDVGGGRQSPRLLCSGHMPSSLSLYLLDSSSFSSQAIEDFGQNTWFIRGRLNRTSQSIQHLTLDPFCSTYHIRDLMNYAYRNTFRLLPKFYRHNNCNNCPLGIPKL